MYDCVMSWLQSEYFSYYYELKTWTISRNQLRNLTQQKSRNTSTHFYHDHWLNQRTLSLSLSLSLCPSLSVCRSLSVCLSVCLSVSLSLSLKRWPCHTFTTTPNTLPSRKIHERRYPGNYCASSPARGGAPRQEDTESYVKTFQPYKSSPALTRPAPDLPTSPSLISLMVSLDVKHHVSARPEVALGAERKIRPVVVVRLQEIPSGSIYKNSSKNRAKLSLVFGHF